MANAVPERGDWRIVEKRFGRDIGKQDETLQIEERASKMWKRRIKKD